MDPIIALVPKARRRWAKTDPIMARLAKEHPLDESPLLERDGFRALVSAIIHQQVSIAAGRTIYGRLETTLRGKITPTGVLRIGAPRLREAGLSGAKAAYVLDLAARTKAKGVDFSSFQTMPDEEVIATLTEVKGIGTWTAKMFLMWHLHRPDVHAPEDLGLRMAVARFYGVPDKEVRRFMDEQREHWRPYATVAARVLWKAHHATPVVPGKVS